MATLVQSAFDSGGFKEQTSAVWRELLRERRFDALFLGLGLSAVPVSIAVAESLLAVSLLFRVLARKGHPAPLYWPRVFWWWLVWAAVELLVYLRSPDLRNGWGEIRHLLLLAALFLLLPALQGVAERIAVWRGIFLTATLSSLVLIATFVWRLLSYRGQLDPVVYLRNGGLLHHWMIYGTVEILVFAGLLEFRHLYSEARRWWLPVFLINAAAILLSLTRMLWVVCLLLLFLHLISRRSRWVWAVPLIPFALFLVAPGPVRSRVADSSDPAYYSNAERLQMLRVGWQMVRERPWTGVGPGRVDQLYLGYLSPQDPVPAYHGHLHNNVVQLAAEFGLPVTLAALVFVAVLFRDLLRARRSAMDRPRRFLSRTALLGLTGFLAAGMFDYTYGHSLGLILLSFVVLMPLIPAAGPELRSEVFRRSDSGPAGDRAIAAADRVLGMALLAASLPLLAAAAAVTCALSRRSPFVAHLRVGRYSRMFWVWKLRTMWPDEAVSPPERGWVQRIEEDPAWDEKPHDDPRVTSRFAAFCRRHSIDELPQLLHVVRGEMSLVGPRPVTRAELARHYGRWATEVLKAKPGLTGYWQTQGRNALTYPDRVALDLQLVQDLSPRVYLRVLLRTVPELLQGRNAR